MATTVMISSNYAHAPQTLFLPTTNAEPMFPNNITTYTLILG